MTPDHELLRQYADIGSEDAFAELVRRHVNLVYSAAMRQVGGNAHLAQEVAQTVFADLARKAASLAGRQSLSGWLYTSAHFAAAKISRAEQRRRDREEEFMREPTHETAPDPGPAEVTEDWQKIHPVLDRVMHQLNEAEREAILLRYFENRPFAEVGAKLGLGENAARMRVARALDKLRGLLARRGVTTSAALVTAISANAVQIAPVTLAATLTSGSLAAAGAAAPLTILKIMTAAKLHLGLSALVIVGATTALVIQHQAQTRLRRDNESLQQQLDRIRTEKDDLSNRLAVVGDAPSPPADQLGELLRLRGEVGALRRATNELWNSVASSRRARSGNTEPSPETQPPSTLPEDYPKTPDTATRSVFESWSRGDWNAFFTNFEVEGGRELWDKAMDDRMKSNLLGMEVVGVGEPTNSFGPNMWFVPYTVRFRNGGEKSFRLHIAQDPKTQRWILKGGF